MSIRKTDPESVDYLFKLLEESSLGQGLCYNYQAINNPNYKTFTFVIEDKSQVIGMFDVISEYVSMWETREPGRVKLVLNSDKETYNKEPIINYTAPNGNEFLLYTSKKTLYPPKKKIKPSNLWGQVENYYGGLSGSSGNTIYTTITDSTSGTVNLTTSGSSTDFGDLSVSRSSVYVDSVDYSTGTLTVSSVQEAATEALEAPSNENQYSLFVSPGQLIQYQNIINETASDIQYRTGYTYAVYDEESEE